MSEKNDLNRQFDHHPPKTAADGQAHAAITKAFKVFAVELLANIPQGRERSITITKLQEARMWANAALAARRYDQDIS